MKYFIFLLLMIGFVSAVDIDFDCPDEIFVDEEFECLLEVFDGNGEYDVKIDLDGERNSALEVWNDGVWKSGYYYLIEFIEDGDEEDIKMKISEEGDWDGSLKLRQGDKREFFDIEIEVLEKNVVYTKEEDVVAHEEKVGIELVLHKDEDKVLLLNNNSDNGDVIYVSKNMRVINLLPYGFCFFLIFVIVILLWERF